MSVYVVSSVSTASPQWKLEELQLLEQGLALAKKKILLQIWMN